MSDLYPIKFKAQLKEKIWGGQNLKSSLNKDIPKNKKIGESWEISCVEDNISVVANGFLEGNELDELIEIYMGDLIGDKVYDKFGINFPLLIKFIDANDALSIQVHPDDKLAKERYNAFGKTEMWYVIEANKNAELISGFNQEIDKAKYLQHLKNNELPQILNYEKVKSGDVFFIPAGRVHAIGAGIVLAEIQQTSDVTYRIFDWNRKDDKGNSRELHTDEALDAIDFKVFENYKTEYTQEKNTASNILSNKYFETNILDLDKALEIDSNRLDSFIIYICLEGKIEIRYYESEKIILEKGETVLIPAVIEHLILNPVVHSKLIEVYIPDESKSKK